MTQIFIDGSAGTTGLRIYERLAQRKDISLLLLSEAERKDPAARRDALNRADLAFLCLPDAAAVEAVSMLDNPDTVIIDTSTAHRTAPDWVYGFPELTGQREKIVSSKRISNPGCHASGFISLIAPLTECGLLPRDIALTCFSLTGYSGGGKKMIADYTDAEKKDALEAPRMYGLSQTHKHLPEMQTVCGLKTAPHFSPVVSSYYAGMEVVVPLFAEQLPTGVDAACIRSLYREYYNGKLIAYADDADENGFVSSGRFAGRDDMQITVCGNDERITLISRFDNLGKGASGAAIQNMNLILGLDEICGLNF